MMVNAPDAPVRLVSITSSLDDFLKNVTTKNVSDKTVRSFQLGVVLSVPQGCGESEVFGNEEVQRIDSVNLAPGVSVQTQDYKFEPKRVSDFRVGNHGDVAESQLTVIRVDFVDGSSWSISRTGPIYDIRLLGRVAELRCSKSPEAVLARSKASCDSLLAASPLASGGGTGYICVGAPDQSCSNQDGGKSCISSICTGGLCPAQTCSCPTCPKPNQ
jgi:hypothetical protein